MYDIKYLMKFCDNLHGGLNKLAEVLDVDRIGPQHQARQHATSSTAAFVLKWCSSCSCWLMLSAGHGLTWGAGTAAAGPHLRAHSAAHCASRASGGWGCPNAVCLQAGSDSLLTSSTFLKLMRTSFDGVAGVDKHVGILYGLGSGAAFACYRPIVDHVVCC